MHWTLYNNTSNDTCDNVHLKTATGKWGIALNWTLSIHIFQWFYKNIKIKINNHLKATKYKFKVYNLNIQGVYFREAGGCRPPHPPRLRRKSYLIGQAWWEKSI